MTDANEAIQHPERIPGDRLASAGRHRFLLEQVVDFLPGGSA
jgi:hypothetical protein